MQEQKRVTVLGAGLAGCEAALWLAAKGVAVDLYEQKPIKFSPAHQGEGFAELICSNSLKAERLDSASGLLKAEMRLMGSKLLEAAETARVAAGGALAVDRDLFSAEVTKMVKAEALITIHTAEATQIDQSSPILVATGPLTEGALAEEIKALTGDERLHFYDAVAPIVTAESLDYNKVFAASRYGRGEADYLNCPFRKDSYDAFVEALVAAERAPVHDFDAPPEQAAEVATQGDAEAQTTPATPKKDGGITVYEGCMPIEVMAARGHDTMRFGPLRPVGLVDPNTDHRPWANVQLRAENKERTLYNIVGFQTNLKWGEQKRVFSMIPGLEQAEFIRYGVMHRNTFLDSPRVLSTALCLKAHPNVFFAGQITGFEGYMESAASGLLAARNLYAQLCGETLSPPPRDTMCGALLDYITTPNKNFQPMGANIGILPSITPHIRDKRERYMKVAERAVESFTAWESALWYAVKNEE
ncbi:MAG: methylenetetrahydrofolate--tRNA-(uracil(54)-C(5))-methyltransferase (FADH(2)-oxidizing) TrmFO [Faecalibacterium sp.]